ncbi:uncharacterized protein QC764_708600 [Podospora pseudoanserina]|uniref:AMP-activated protein kinase glycogen-binding domain-containing protein n=1 Tax=Podospora pseudoanserina TaxID=2609844 RepID=A0ABR0HKQ1_9PEZI|nr:hypothetical protein QC764_708600 [Podospora pseudoanserina]
MPSDKVPVVVTYEKPGTQPPIYVAGTFSNPPWTPEEMSYTTDQNGEHVFSKEVIGEIGSKHQYKFRIGNGDWWDLAPGQPTVTDSSGNTNHELEIQPPKESKPDSIEDKKPAVVGEEKSSDEPAGLPEKFQGQKESAEEPEEAKAFKPIEVVEETQAPQESVTVPEAAEPLKPTEVVEETPAPKKPVEEPKEAEAPMQSIEETQAPKQPVEAGKEDEAPKQPTETVEETHVPKEVEAPKQPEVVPQAPNEATETSEQPEASKEQTAVTEKSEDPKESTEVVEDLKKPTEVSEESDVPKIRVKDSTTTNIVLPNGSILEAIKAQEIRTQSGAGTPDFVKTAAEVADSAALLHEEVPAKDPRDGLLERAPTPMSKTAETAAEVADTAEVLDRVDAILISEPHIDDDDDDDNLLGPPSASQGDELPALKSPLFPHECPSPPTPGDAVERRESSDDRSPMEDIDPDQIDLNDPTLERFPSNREEIIDTVRKLETSLNEDQASFEGVPPSPVINSPLEGTQDITDYILGDSSIPTSHRGSQHLEVPRPSHGSASSVPVSPSLQVISEAEEPASEENGTTPSPIIFSNPEMKSRPSSLKPRSEDDEGVSLKDSISPRTTEAPKTAGDILFRDTPPLEASGDAAPTKANGLSLEDHSNTSKVADEAEAQVPDDRSAAPAPVAVGERATDDEIAESSHTTALESANNTNSLKKRAAPAPEVEQEIPRVTSPVSNRTTGVEHNGVSWIQAFFRLLFVDIIGGFISRLCGGKKRNTT